MRPNFKRALYVTLAAVVALAGGLGWWQANRPRTTAAPTSPSLVPPWFIDATAQVGLDFIHDPGPIDDQFFMPQIVGSGGALFDFDGDGRLDILLLNNGGPKGRPNALYRQLADGKFSDVGRGSGLDFSGYCMGAAIGDVNNDSRPDVLVTEFGKLGLYLNEENGKFTAPAESGIASALWGTSACFLDFDRDGWLDLVVANYVDYDPAWPCANAGSARDYCHPKVFQGTVAKLFRNITGQASAGDSTASACRFEDVTVSSGLARSPGPGLGVASADFNGDGWPDIFVANDAHANHLWINQQNGSFEEDAVSRGVAYDAVGRSLANMGIALGDTHGAGRLDLFVTHLPEETNTLWRQEPRGLFADRTMQSGLLDSRSRATGFGAVLADFDLDGQLDLAIANGRVVRRPGPANDDHWSAYADRNQVYAGNGPGRFNDVSAANPEFCDTPNVARGLAVGDINGDGLLDLLVTSIGGRARLLYNVASEQGHWLLIQAIDPRFKRDALGAEVTVVADERRHVAWVNPGQSYLTSHDSRVHFGLGSAAAVQAIEVLWPDGLWEHFPGGSVDRVVVINRGAGEKLESQQGSAASAP